jgi:hypothetical protein
MKNYEKLIASGTKSQDLLQNLGNAYYFKADLVNAAKWYGELFNYISRKEKVRTHFSNFWFSWMKMKQEEFFSKLFRLSNTPTLTKWPTGI